MVMTQDMTRQGTTRQDKTSRTRCNRHRLMQQGRDERKGTQYGMEVRLALEQLHSSRTTRMELHKWNTRA
jgi:hypothetical protein